MIPQHSIRQVSPAPSVNSAPSARLHTTKRSSVGRVMRTGVVCGLFGLASSALVAPTEASATGFGPSPFAPGSVVVAQGGTIAGEGGQRDRCRGGMGVEGLPAQFQPCLRGTRGELHQWHERPLCGGLRPVGRLMGGQRKQRHSRRAHPGPSWAHPTLCRP